jgi:polar amino acid transport system substrate-binding protein
MRRHRGRALAVALAAGVLLVAGCSYEPTEFPAAPETEQPEESGSEPSDCDMSETVRSYAPQGASRDAAVDQLVNDGRLVAGVSADSYLLGSRNPFSGRIEGFDIDVARRIADGLGVELELRVITAADRIELLVEEEIDIVVRAMTINCERWEEIAFSSVYYQAGQKVLLRDDLAADYSEPADLAGLRVCAPNGTTSLERIRDESPDAEVVPADSHTGCLVLFQQGDVDAITGDDTVLAGLAAQDPYAEVPDQQAFSEEPYGVGVNPGNRVLVRSINGVLEEMRRDGSWQRSYDRWLAGTLGSGAQPPQPTYGRPG